MKYSGNLDEVRNLGASVEEMRNEYAILTVKESQIPLISALPQIEYIEKPQRLFFAINQAKTASCVNILQEAPPNLKRFSELIAVLDSGIDYFQQSSESEDGSTRILELWDQTQNRIYTSEEINTALESGKQGCSQTDRSFCDVMAMELRLRGIAAGLDSGYRGIAYESDLLVVKLGTARPCGFPRTTELMRAGVVLFRLPQTGFCHW